MSEVEDGSMSVKSSLSSFLKILSSYNSNVLLAALVFLLLVVLFVLLLHFYARFFWSPSHQDFSAAARQRRRRRRNRRRTVTTTRIIPSLPLRGFDGGVNAPATAATSDDKGLDSSVISSIPLFVYEEDEEEEGEEEEECVICLGLWEAGDFGRKLRNCGHGFHVECIDMWLSSHSTCPLCRSPVLAVASNEENLKPAVNAVEEEAEVRLQMSPTGEDENNIAGDRRSLAVMEDDLKTGDDDGEEEVRIEVFDDEEINGGGSRSDRRRSMSMTSSASSSLMKMLSSSRSERNKVFPTARQDSSK
ncbi:Zinc finger RING-type [Arabidopsis thaliana x Arabidopsis arenosa]|uniref:RING-type E3 ubiquitin transferase n=1 Tax=Arabidopsis thaliana x Arabidopsis arenosa TaxID=1240361 RepID=A0A8T1XKL7_9BRAS|nr:Zinc finger RING-type [Arabidopsis thaliana x Arabidopsis arenosa]